MENSARFQLFLCLSIAITLFGLTTSLPEVIKIGGIFESFDDDREMAFRYAVDRINSNPSILPDSRLSVKIERIKPHSSFHASKSVCSLLKEGAVAIFGPSSLASSALVQSTANTLNIPHFETRHEYQKNYGTYTVNLFPDLQVLGKAIYDLVKSKNWRSFTIVYEDDEELVKLQELLKLRNQNAVKISLRQYTGEYRYNKILKDIRKRGETNLVLGVPTQRIKDVMTEAQKAGMITEYHNYILISLDFHTLDLSGFQHCRSNISAFRIIDPEHQYYAEEARKWIFGDIRTDRVSKKDSPIKTETALLVDAVNFFAQALARKDFIPVFASQTVSCDSTTIWPYGYDLMNSIPSVRMTGLTYFVEIDSSGRRTNFTLDLLELKAKGIVKIGEWNPTTNITYSTNYSRDLNDKKDDLSNITLRVTSIEEADLAIADLTITLSREEAVDFTMPFMSLGIGILFKKPTKNAPTLFSFLSPFSFEVWVYVATAYLGVSLLLFVLARISPYEWVSPHPCNPKTEYLENTFSLLNSFWFTIGSLMQQGSDIAPKAISTRTVASLWWFFTLIMISSYTANLAAFLTAERMKSPIESADDLAKQNDIQYGCVKSGSTRSFFQASKLQPYKRMWTVMQTTQPSVFTKTNDQGVERVKKGNYAFLMESTSIEYNTERDCDLAQIGNLLDSKGYGIATPPGSPYRSLISSEILMLQEEGFLHMLKDKWWKDKGGGLCVDDDKKPSSASELGLPNVGGVFVVLLAGLGMSAIISVLEFIWKTKKIPRDERRMVLLEMLYELKDICMCRGSSRPPPNYLNGDPLRSSTDNGFVLHTSASFNTMNESS